MKEGDYVYCIKQVDDNTMVGGDSNFTPNNIYNFINTKYKISRTTIEGDGIVMFVECEYNDRGYDTVAYLSGPTKPANRMLNEFFIPIEERRKIVLDAYANRR